MDEAQLDYLLAVLRVPDAAVKLQQLHLATSSAAGRQSEGGGGVPDTLAPLIAQVKVRERKLSWWCLTPAPPCLVDNQHRGCCVSRPLAGHAA